MTFISVAESENLVGKQVVLLEDVETLAGIFTKGHEMTITGTSVRGWDLIDKEGNRILEAGWNNHREYKILED